MNDAEPRPRYPLWLQALLFVLGALAMYRPVWSIDFGMHLAAGLETIHRSGGGEIIFPKADMLSFVAQGEEWIVHEWFAQVLFAGIYIAFGGAEQGIEALKISAALVCGLATAILGLGFARRGMRPMLVFAACLLALWFFESRFRLRPHLITLLGAALLFSQPRTPWSWFRCVFAALFYVVWLNCHNGWVLVPIHFATLAVLQVLARGRWRWSASVFVVSLALALVNPRGYLLPLSILSIGDIADLVPEWQSAFTLGAEFRLKAIVSVVLALCASACAIVFIRSRRRGDEECLDAAEHVAPALWPQALGLSSQRFLFLQVFCLPALRVLRPATTKLLERFAGQERSNAIGRALPALALAACGLLFAIGQGERWLALGLQPGGPGAAWSARFPHDAVREIRESSAIGRVTSWVACPPAWSGYVLVLWPHCHTATDGRVELFGRQRTLLWQRVFEGREPIPHDPVRPEWLLAPRAHPLHPKTLERYTLVFEGRLARLYWNTARKAARQFVGNRITPYGSYGETQRDG